MSSNSVSNPSVFRVNTNFKNLNLGSQGPQGDIGFQGEKGDTGNIGPQGFKGDIGNIGSQGPQGEIGPQGEKGEINKQIISLNDLIIEGNEYKICDLDLEKNTIISCLINCQANTTGDVLCDFYLTNVFNQEDKYTNIYYTIKKTSGYNLINFSFVTKQTSSYSLFMKGKESVPITCPLINIYCF
jgi:hypothetical protein